jgi:hypothetical protein
MLAYRHLYPVYMRNALPKVHTVACALQQCLHGALYVEPVAISLVSITQHAMQRSKSLD